MIPLPMFDQFLLITLQVLVLYSLAHLKLHLRLWIHLHISPSTFISLQNYQILLILVILHHLLPFYLLFIVSLSSLPIKRQFLIRFGSKLWMRNFLLCIRQILGIWFLYLLVRVLLVVVGCIRSRLILMGLLSDTKLGWLQKDTLNSMVWTMRRHLPRLQK